MPDLKTDIKRMQELTFEAYKLSGGVLALMDDKNAAPGRLASLLDEMAGQLEASAVELRILCETHQPRLTDALQKPKLPALEVAGFVEVNEYGWLHISLNTLLPGCRFRTPVWLTDTIVRLLDHYERRQKLPTFHKALLIIDEHCNIESRQVFDQDNKNWKSIPNAIKGRLISDDDQFTLGVCLLSTRSDKPACHIYLLPPQDAGDFFFMRADNYPFRT